MIIFKNYYYFYLFINDIYIYIYMLFTKQTVYEYITSLLLLLINLLIIIRHSSAESPTLYEEI